MTKLLKMEDMLDRQPHAHLSRSIPWLSQQYDTGPAMNATNNGSPDPNPKTRGWVSQPNGRGTFDLLVSCAVTVFLCGWSSICVNVPANEPVPDQSKWNLFWDKWYMFCLSLLGPEFVFLLALGQYTSAADSVKSVPRKRLHGLDHQTWILR